MNKDNLQQSKCIGTATRELLLCLCGVITKTRLFNYIDNFTFKTWKISDKSDLFRISAQNIDCGYSLEPPRRGGSNEYPQSMFLSRNKKNIVYPHKPQFYYIKVEFKGVKIIKACFRDGMAGMCLNKFYCVKTSAALYANATPNYKHLFGPHRGPLSDQWKITVKHISTRHDAGQYSSLGISHSTWKNAVCDFN